MEFASTSKIVQSKEMRTVEGVCSEEQSLHLCLRPSRVGQRCTTVRRIKNRTVSINIILMGKNGLFQPNTDEYIAHVFVVDGSTFGVDDKLHRTWHQG